MSEAPQLQARPYSQNCCTIIFLSDKDSLPRSTWHGNCPTPIVLPENGAPISECSNGLISEQSFWQQDNAVFIIDGAQLSYADTLFWIECIKGQKDNSAGPFLILFSSFGSPTAKVLKIEGSAPVDLSPNQRVSLLPRVDDTTGLSLCFDLNEVEDLCSSIIGNRFNVDREVLQYLFVLTNGHPGLTLGLLKTLFEREVS